MKSIFIEICERLEAEVPELAWVDKEKGQMSFGGTPVLFPAALVRLGTRTLDRVTPHVQLKELTVQVTLCFDFTGNTNTKTPAVHLEKSLVYYDILEKVQKALQGWGGSTFNALEETGFTPRERPDAYTTEVLNYTATFEHDLR